MGFQTQDNKQKLCLFITKFGVVIT